MVAPAPVKGEGVRVARFGRLLTAMVTPFKPDLSVDLARAAELAERLVGQGSEGLVVCGTTGEAPTVSPEEKLALFRTVADAVRGKALVLGGTSTYDTAESVHLTRAASETGIDGLLFTAPYYSRPPQEGLYRHFRTLAEASALPAMLYNIPSRTGVNVASATTIRLARDVPNIAAIKECGDSSQVAEILSGVDREFDVYSGDDGNALPWMSIGAVGVVSVASHVVGPEMRQMIDAFFKGDVIQAAAVHRRLLPVFKGLFVVTNPVLTKAAMELVGFPVGSLRLPLVEATAAEKAALRSVLEHTGVLVSAGLRN